MYPNTPDVKKERVLKLFLKHIVLTQSQLSRLGNRIADPFMLRTLVLELLEEGKLLYAPPKSKKNGQLSKESIYQIAPELLPEPDYIGTTHETK